MTWPKPVALKEWAVAVQALAEGEQIIIMRKGGIAEETADFELESESFYLFPTYEHQKHALVKEAYRGKLDETLIGWSPDRQEVPIACYAEAAADFPIEDAELLPRLRDFHIWTDSFADERLHWKRKKPLHVIALRAYRLEPVQLVPVLPEYAGCKSWLRLETAIPDTIKTPALSEALFEEQLAAVRKALGR